jgi:hypothetical protein
MKWLLRISDIREASSDVAEGPQASKEPQLGLHKFSSSAGTLTAVVYLQPEAKASMLGLNRKS